MKLLRQHPQVATRDCGHCQQFQYDEKTGKVVQWRGKPLPRIPQAPAPCRTRRGCPKGTPEQPNGLDERNLKAYRHNRECKAVGQFPDDPIVRRNARIIDSVENMLERQRQDELTQLFALHRRRK